MSADARLEELKLELPPAPKPGGTYRPVVVTGNMAYVSGHGPLRTDKTLIIKIDLLTTNGKFAFWYSIP